MSDHPRNVVASIQDRLANKANELGKPYGEMLQYYGMERFLYRLRQTRFKDSFILKGGLVFYSLEVPFRRLTRDIDFLSLTENKIDVITRAITDAISISVTGDGIIFDLDTLKVESTQVDADRNGIKANFTGCLGRSKIPIQIDFGFSDELTTKAVEMSFPIILQGMIGLQIMQYPIESVVAEKFHTMERFAAIPSRWKDYYDIWLISENFIIDDQSLQKAIAMTFTKRDTVIPSGRPLSLTVDFAIKYNDKWKKFMKKSDFDISEINDLPVLVEKIWVFLEWPLQGLLNFDPNGTRRKWNPPSEWMRP